MRLEVAVLPPPSNASFAPPLVSEAALLPPSAGYFRFGPVAAHGVPPPRSSARPQLLLPTAGGAESLAGGAVRALLTLSVAAPLDLCAVGPAAAVARLYGAIGRVSSRAHTRRALRSHRYAAIAARPNDALHSAASGTMYPRCARDALLADLFALLAPALLPTHAAAIVLDPAAMPMTPPARLWATLNALSKAHCAAAAADAWSHTDADHVALEPGLLLLRLDAMRRAKWIPAVHVALRHTAARPRGAAGTCPRELLGRLLAPRGGVCPARYLDCTAAYQPLAHTRHHALATLPSEGMRSMYAICRHEITHQAFARSAEREYAAVHGASPCPCGRRIDLLLPPADAEGVRYDPRQPRLAHMLGDGVGWLHLWSAWANDGRPEGAALARAISSRADVPPPRVLAIADRTREGEPLFVMAARPGRGEGGGGGARGSNEGGGGSVGGVSLIYPCGYAGAEEEWITQTMLGACNVTSTCLIDLLRRHADGDASAVRALLAPGSVVVLQTSQFGLIDAVLSASGISRASLNLVHISDGNIYEDRISASVARYAAWRSAFRQYWLDDDAHSLAASVRRGEVQWFPIGMNPQWVRLVERIRNGSLTIPRASARRHRISFLGSTHKSDRAMRIAAVERASYMRVHHHAGDRACYGKGCADTRYVDETLDSVLCLHLPGSSVESNRLYEQLEGGCIPLIIEHFGPGEEAVGTKPTYGDVGAAATRAAFTPLADVSGAPPPFVVVSHESELPSALGRIFADADALDALQSRVLEWWAKAKRHYAAAFEAAACPARRADAEYR